MRIRFAVMLALAVSLLGGRASATTLSVDISGDNGVVRTTEPGLSCAEGGQGSYRHIIADGRIAPGVLSQLGGTARAEFDVHHNGANAFLGGDASQVVLSTQRGSITITLNGGSCAQPGLGFDGTTASLTGGTWGGVRGAGAYREAAGSGIFGVTAELNPGADNHWSLKLDGAITVLQPALAARVERVYWGNLGLDYLSRVVSVDFRVGNTGRGDSFGARLSQVDTPAGAQVCGEPPGLLAICPPAGPAPRSLGDLEACGDPALPASCDTEILTVRYQLPLLGGPCTLVVLGCVFTTGIHAVLPDALDAGAPATVPVTVTAPNLPPPL